jgi:hypothetical protein
LIDWRTLEISVILHYHRRFRCHFPEGQFIN